MVNNNGNVMSPTHYISSFQYYMDDLLMREMCVGQAPSLMLLGSLAWAYLAHYHTCAFWLVRSGWLMHGTQQLSDS
jgi:hypothetical protein